MKLILSRALYTQHISSVVWPSLDLLGPRFSQYMSAGPSNEGKNLINFGPSSAYTQCY